MSDELDDIAKRYRVDQDFDAVLARYEVNLIGSRRRGDSVLELGCGDGIMTKGFHEMFARVVAVDGSDVCVQRAMANAPNACIVQCMLEDFDTVEQFTDITLVRVLEHLDDPVEMLVRAAEWLRDDGNLHLIVPNALSMNRRLGVEMGMMPNAYHLHERDIAHGHKRVYDFMDICRTVMDAGLSISGTDGVMLKPLSNAQMATWDPDIILGLMALGHQVPELATEIYVRCVRR